MARKYDNDSKRVSDHPSCSHLPAGSPSAGRAAPPRPSSGEEGPTDFSRTCRLALDEEGRQERDSWSSDTFLCHLACEGDHHRHRHSPM